VAKDLDCPTRRVRTKRHQ